MRKIIVVLLAAVLLLTAGCAALPVAPATEGPASTTPATAVPETTTLAPETVPATSEAPVSTEPADTDAPATTTEAPEPAPVDPLSLLGEADSVQGVFTDDEGNEYRHSYSIPRILADTEGAQAINEDIEERFRETMQFAKEAIAQNDDSGLGSLKYRGLVWEDVLTVIITEYEYYDWTDYAVYCYEVPTGRWLTTPLLLEKMGFSQEAFLEACRVRFHDRFIENYSSLPEEFYEEADYYNQLEAQTRDEYVNLDLMAYPDRGDVVVVAPILSLVGPAFYYTPIPLGLGGPLSLLEEASSETGDFTDEYGYSCTWSYTLPRLLADTPDARAINAEIDARFGANIREAKECMAEGSTPVLLTTSYRGHLWEDILSIEIVEHTEWDFDDYGVYCYAVSEGKRLSTAELVERMGCTNEEFLDACREQFRQQYLYLYHQIPEESREDYGYYTGLDRQTTDEFVNMDLMAYPENGGLTVIAPIVSLAGADYYYYKIYIPMNSGN